MTPKTLTCKQTDFAETEIMCMWDRNQCKSRIDEDNNEIHNHVRHSSFMLGCPRKWTNQDYVVSSVKAISNDTSSCRLQIQSRTESQRYTWRVASGMEGEIVSKPGWDGNAGLRVSLLYPAFQCRSLQRKHDYGTCFHRTMTRIMPRIEYTQNGKFTQRVVQEFCREENRDVSLDTHRVLHFVDGHVHDRCHDLVHTSKEEGKPVPHPRCFLRITQR